MKRLYILTTCTFKMKLRSMFYEPRLFNLISAFWDFNGKPNYSVIEKKSFFVGFNYQTQTYSFKSYDVSYLQHPSPLKEPILSIRTPKQLLSPPFLYRPHERLEALMRSLKSLAKTFSLAVSAHLAVSKESQVCCSGALNTDLSLFPSIPSTPLSST